MLKSLKSLMRRLKILPPSPYAFPAWTNRIPELARYSIGQWTYGVPVVYDWEQEATLVIGKYCSIADGAKILLGGEHRTDWVSTFPFVEALRPPPNGPLSGKTKGDVHIGHDVWIGMGAVILSGVTVGSGAVIAAGSVVTKSVQPYSIVAGNPARHMRFRFPEHLISQLLNIGWWNWPHGDVVKAAPLLLSNQIEEFTRVYGSK